MVKFAFCVLTQGEKDMELQWIIFEFIISFLEMLTSCYFITRVFRKEINYHREIAELIVFSLCGALLLSLREGGILPISDYLPAVLIVGSYAFFKCGAKWWSAVLWALLNYLLIGIVVITINSCLSFVLDIPLEELRIRADFRIMKRVVVRLGHILASALIALILKKVQRQRVAHHKESGLILVAIISILILMGLWNFQFSLTEGLVQVFNICICLLILCINFVLLFFREVLVRFQIDNKELKEQNQLIHQQIRNQNELNEMYNCIRGLKHDLNNHFHAILGYMQLAEYQKAEEYIWKIAGEVADIETYHSGNEIVDAIMGSKTTLAKNEAISVNIELSIPEQINIPEEHLTIVLGNLYDNAIDANLKILEVEKRYIKARVKLQKESLLIYFENAANDQEDSGDKKIWKTTKRDIFEHGFGLKNIDRIVRLHDGYCDRNLKEGVFRCSIRIPIE